MFQLLITAVAMKSTGLFSTVVVKKWCGLSTNLYINEYEIEGRNSYFMGLYQSYYSNKLKQRLPKCIKLRWDYAGKTNVFFVELSTFSSDFLNHPRISDFYWCSESKLFNTLEPLASMIKFMSSIVHKLLKMRAEAIFNLYEGFFTVSFSLMSIWRQAIIFHPNYSYVFESCEK